MPDIKSFSHEFLYDLCGKNGTLVSKSSSSNVWRQIWDGKECYVKKYEYSFFGSFAYFFRPSRAMREWQAYQIFSTLGLPCPKVLACQEKRILGYLRWGIIITESIPNTIDLWQFFCQCHSGETAQRQAIIVELAEKIALLHHHNFCHADFKLRNILYSTTEQKLYWIDCPSWRYFSKLEKRTILRDIGDMYRYVKNVWSLEEWNIFLSIYSEHVKYSVDTIKFLVSQIIPKKMPNSFNKNML